MWIPRNLLQDLVFGAAGGQRFTQDSPVMPDVWFAFGHKPGIRHDLLMTPARGVAPADLRKALITLGQRSGFSNWEERLGGMALAYDESYVVGKLDLDELLCLAMPLSPIWRRGTPQLGKLTAEALTEALSDPERTNLSKPDVWLLRLVGSLVWARDTVPDAEGSGDANSIEEDSEDERSRDKARVLPSVAEYAAPLARYLSGINNVDLSGIKPRLNLWSVNRNRRAEIAVNMSSQTIKADAATRIYQLRCDALAWAVMDTGIDATHAAFRLRRADGKLCAKKGAEAGASRVVASYDFTRIRELLDDSGDSLPSELGRTGARRQAELRRRLRFGQAIDWELLEPFLRIPHDKNYRPPQHPHGTHVAGILAGDWRAGDPGFEPDLDGADLVGVCPDIRLYDLRVLDERGEGDEFSVLAALQFVRYLNHRNRRPLIQGVNMSLSIPHDVSNFACGRTPVCEEASRTHASGVLVVAAAGNKGYVHYLTPKGETEAYQNISITDPGNAESVLTVGATHRRRPHTYGVSYFSSRGPTGDGRMKPDLVAPGEKILSPVPGNSAETKDGTSMAAPHVSGAAALIMSRHPEFIGEPDRIKAVLCDTATDLGRERYFQGAGLVDVSRALGSL